MTSNIMENWNGAFLENSYRYYNITYDSNGNLTLYFRDDWDGTDWVHSSRYTYTYDNNGNQTLYLNEIWNGGNWENSSRYTYTYDSDGNITSFLSESWDGTIIVLSNRYFRFVDSYGYYYYYFNAAKVEIYYNTITDVNEENIIISNFSLSQNYPNPFNPSTMIRYTLPEESNVILKAFDMLGREVTTLVNKQQKAGYYEVNWNANNLSSGIYFYRIKAGSFVDTKKMILLR